MRSGSGALSTRGTNLKYYIAEQATNYINQYILTSIKNASLIITDVLAMIYKNEQPRTAFLCRGWEMLENDINLICR